MAIGNVKTLCDRLEKENHLVKRVLKSEYGEVYILYVKQLTDVEMLTQNIIRPIQKYWQERGGTLTGAVCDGARCCGRGLQDSGGGERGLRASIERYDVYSVSERYTGD